MMQYQNNKVTQLGASIWKSALAGLTATIPMTIFMLLTQRFLPGGQRYDLPPELITKDLARKAHIRWRMNKGQILGATTLSHLGYGAVMGTLYGPLGKQKLLPASLQGIFFGVVVWAASYLGLLPMLGIAESGHREPGQRNLMMIAAHIVWGAVLGTVADALMRDDVGS